MTFIEAVERNACRFMYKFISLEILLDRDTRADTRATQTKIKEVVQKTFFQAIERNDCKFLCFMSLEILVDRDTIADTSETQTKIKEVVQNTFFQAVLHS